MSLQTRLLQTLTEILIPADDDVTIDLWDVYHEVLDHLTDDSALINPLLFFCAVDDACQLLTRNAMTRMEATDLTCSERVFLLRGFTYRQKEVSNA